MSNIRIEEIARIKLEPNEKLLVRLPDDTDAAQFDEVRKSLLEFFDILPNRLMVYVGDVDFKKVVKG